MRLDTSLGKILWGTGKRAFVFGILFALILLYALCVNIEEYAISQTTKISILSCDGEQFSDPLEVTVSQIGESFEPDDDSLLFPSCIHVKSLSPLPSFYLERNTCFDAVASKKSGRIKISMFYVFLNRSYRPYQYEINHPILWNIIMRNARERAGGGGGGQRKMRMKTLPNSPKNLQIF